MRPLAHYTVFQDGKRLLHGPLYLSQFRMGPDSAADVRWGAKAALSITLAPLQVTAQTKGCQIHEAVLPVDKAVPFEPKDLISVEPDWTLCVTPVASTTQVDIRPSRDAPIPSILYFNETIHPLPMTSPFVIGSGPGCDLQLEGRNISAVHALLGWVKDRWFVQDQSTNGTLVRGLLLRGGAIEMRPGTVLQIGPHKLQFLPAERPPSLIAQSPAMQGLLAQIDKIAQTDHPVLLLGESGVGKSQIARWIHAKSDRANGPFQTYNAASFTPSLQASELFGHRTGAFTGADQDRAGAFMAAHEGTLFLDEIGDLDINLQASLLVALQEQQVRRLGDDTPTEVNVRLITATNQNMAQAIQLGRCRVDFVSRLGLTYTVPPLRDRPEDVVPLATARLLDGDAPEDIHFDPGAEARLIAHSWPGNVRELFQVVDRLAVMRVGSAITTAMVNEALHQQRNLLPAPVSAASAARLAGPKVRLRKAEIEALLTATRGNVFQAAQRAGVPDSTFRRWIKHFDLNPKAYR